MKNIFFLVLFLLAPTTNLVYAQHMLSVPTDTTASTTSNTSRITSHQTRIPKQKKGQSRRRGGQKEEAQVRIDSLRLPNDSVALLKNKIIELEQQLQELKQAPPKTTKNDDKALLEKLNQALSDSVISTFSKSFHDYYDANAFFCRAVLESPLFCKYDSTKIRLSVETALAMGYDLKNHPYHKLYTTYYDLLINYGTYYQELIGNIGEIVDQFVAFGNSLDKEFERKRFEDRLKNSAYYQIKDVVPKGLDKRYGELRHIFYLDFQIERVRALFKTDESFTKKNFEEILNLLKSN